MFEPTADRVAAATTETLGVGSDSSGAGSGLPSGSQGLDSGDGGGGGGGGSGGDGSGTEPVFGALPALLSRNGAGFDVGPGDVAALSPAARKVEKLLLTEIGFLYEFTSVYDVAALTEQFQVCVENRTSMCLRQCDALVGAPLDRF